VLAIETGAAILNPAARSRVCFNRFVKIFMFVPPQKIKNTFPREKYIPVFGSQFK